MRPTAGSSTADRAFYFDLASPSAYLVAERILHELPRPTEWRPVLARELPGVEPPPAGEIERRAADRDLPPIRWPEDYPFDSEDAMLVATYAKSIGRGVPFAQAAFRQAFAGGHSLARMDNVLVAAAACEMHPAAVLRSIGLARVREQLRGATSAAARAGVTDVPAIKLGQLLFAGEHALDRAVAAL